MSRGGRSSSSSMFAPDERGVDGQIMILQNMKHHVRRLKTVSSTLDTRPPSSTAYRRKPQQKKLDEPHALEKRSGRIRAHVDNKRPQNIDLTSQISRARQQRQKEEMQRHDLELQHMKRRILLRSSVTERKKNSFDTKLYPAQLKRKKQKQPLNLSFSMSALGERPQSAPPVRRSTSSLGASSKSPKANGQRKKSKVQKKKRDREVFEDEAEVTPRRRNPTRADVNSYKPNRVGGLSAITLAELFHRSLVEEIVSSRLYSTEELEEFFENAKTRAVLLAEENRLEGGGKDILLNIVHDLRDEFVMQTM